MGPRLREPSGTMPVHRLLSMLQSAFGVSLSSWNWFDADGSFGMVMDPPDVLSTEQETLDIWLTGEVFDAATAAGGGLVDLVVADDQVDATVAAQVTALAAGAPAALAETKRLLRSGTDLAGQVPALLELSARFFAGEEGQEGIAAFREKRPARWVPSGE